MPGNDRNNAPGTGASGNAPGGGVTGGGGAGNSSHTFISYAVFCLRDESVTGVDRKSTRLNSSHTLISYAVFCLIKKTYTCAHVGSETTSSAATPGLVTATAS